MHHAGPIFDRAVRSFEKHGVESIRIHGVAVVQVKERLP